jgi:hypothetical protein
MNMLASHITSSASSAPNPYWIALIAVLGAVVGAAIAAITQFFTARGSSASQLAALQSYMNHATQEGIRQERRRVYARFLLAMEKWNLLYLDTYEAAQSRWRWRLPKTEAAFEEYRIAHTELDLLAGEDLARLAQRMFNDSLRAMKDAEQGINPDRGHSEGQVFPTQITAAMQAELNISGTIPVDPKTGLRIWDDRGNRKAGHA